MMVQPDAAKHTSGRFTERVCNGMKRGIAHGLKVTYVSLHPAGFKSSWWHLRTQVTLSTLCWVPVVLCKPCEQNAAALISAWLRVLLLYEKSFWAKSMGLKKRKSAAGHGDTRSCALVSFCLAEPWEPLMAVIEVPVHGASALGHSGGVTQTPWANPRVSGKRKQKIQRWWCCERRGGLCSDTAVSSYRGSSNFIRNVLGLCGCPRLIHDVFSGSDAKFPSSMLWW